MVPYQQEQAWLQAKVSAHGNNACYPALCNWQRRVIPFQRWEVAERAADHLRQERIKGEYVHLCVYTNALATCDPIPSSSFHGVTDPVLFVLVRGF